MTTDIIDLLQRERHLRDEEFAGYIDQALSVEEISAVEAHLHSCAQCRLAMAEISREVEADIADPARLNNTVAKIAGLWADMDDDGVTAREVGGTVPEVRQTSAAPTLIEDLEQQLNALIEQWTGALSGLTFLTPSEHSPLADGQRELAGIELPIEPLFEPAALDGPLSWAKGPLQLATMHDSDGRIRSIRAAIGLRADRDGCAIALLLSDRCGHRVLLQLTPQKLTHVLTTPPLEGRLEDFDLSILTAKP